MAHYWCSVTLWFSGKKYINSVVILLQVSRIAAAFSLQPPVYLIKSFDNTVIFPSEASGKFNPTSLSPGSEYEVQGSEHHAVTPTVSTFPGPQTPFGAYPFTQCPQPSLFAHHQSNVPRFKHRSIKKTILLANLSPRDPSKASSSKSSRFTHTVVTQVIISLDLSMGECTVSKAAELVKRQVGFDVVLLDSKLFPVIDGESTSGPEFWRSTRKIIAVSRSSYEKLTGVPAGNELSQIDEDVVTEPPRKKIKADTSIISKFDAIEKKLDVIDRKLSFLENMKKVFECVICRSTVCCPVVSTCCQRIIGCRVCVSTWRTTNQRCPLCSVSGSMDTMELKGIDDAIAVFRAGEDTREGDQPVDVDNDSDNSSDDFVDLPPFNVSRS